MKKTWRKCLGIIGLFSLAPLFAVTQSKSNIVFVMADDIGSSELGNYGNRFNETLEEADSEALKKAVSSVTALANEKVKALNEQVGLSDTQYKKVYEMFFTSFRNKAISGKSEEQKKAFEKNDNEQEKRLKEILTPSQWEKFSKPTYKNPLQVKFGDPYIMYDKQSKTYYMYGTGGGAKDGFATYSSIDLVNWKNEGQVYFGNRPNTWGIHAFWAPEVYPVKEKYYMFYSAQWRHNPTNELENFKIGIAVSDKPTGPFKDISDRPLFDPGYPIIDANIFFDTDGRVYLYYSRCCYKHPVESEIATEAKEKGWFDEIEESWVYGIELKPDFSDVIGEPILILRPPVSLKDTQAEWESRSVTSREVNRRWTEGSYTFKKDGLYYMMYSANHFGGENYAVGYATASQPLGPYKKAANNPVLQKNTMDGGYVTGTGHNSIAFSPDGKKMFCVYHGRTTATGKERLVFIDKMEAKNGIITVSGPNTDKQPLPLTKE